MTSSITRPWALWISLLLAIASSGAHARGVSDHAALSAEAESVAVQDGGRVKPLGTLAYFTLLQFSGRTTCPTADGGTLTHTGWLLELLLEPERADTYPVFLIDSPEAMDSIGLAHDKPRMRFSYADLAPLRDNILQQARQWAHLEEKLRSPAQTQVLRLTHNLNQYEALRQFGDVFTAKVELPAGLVPPAASDGVAHGPFSSLLAALQVHSWEEVRAQAPLLAATCGRLAHLADALPLFPPAQGEEVWLSPAGLIELAQMNPGAVSPYIALVAHLERFYGSGGDLDEAASALAAMNAQVSESAATSRELRQIPREIWLYRLNPFYYGLLLYILAFLVAALAWAAPNRPWPYRFAVLLLTVPWAFHVYGIVLRCLIRARPPVTTLYETLLFASAVAVGIAFLCEWMVRRRIAVALGALLGAVGLFLANRYAAVDGRDTMPSLIAVLNTNFWLATHVTSVTIGYAAGLLAGAMAHLYLIGKVFGIGRGNPLAYRPLTRMVYGLICFSLVFTTVGTILGGIWANESWGRFWGWDPKENGALMIVLWELTIVHARHGGHIRETGIHMAAVFGNILIGFAWFGVNLLGVGLHSYGFTSGIHQAMGLFYAFQATMLLIGGLAWLREQQIVVVTWRPPAEPAGKSSE
jgi:ABC-type transport system involved in cytochrome c biogenesis permease subunit